MSNEEQETRKSFAVGPTIKKLRLENGWTQEELGTKLGVTKGTISKWEAESAVARGESLRELCKVFNVPADIFLETGLGADRRVDVDSQKGVGFSYSLTYSSMSTMRNKFLEAYTDQITDGIEAFKAILKGNQTSPALLKNGLLPPRIHSLPHLYRCIDLALRTGAIRVTSVQRNTRFEEELKKHLKLQQCLIAAVDLPPDEVIDQTIRREVVATLVAQTQLQHIANQTRVCITGGPNIARLIEAIPLNALADLNIVWIPLLEARSLEHDIPTSSNALAARAAYNHPGTKHLKMPYLAPFQRTDAYPSSAPQDLKRFLIEAATVLRNANQTHLAFLALGANAYDEQALSGPSSLGIIENRQYLDNLPSQKSSTCVGTVLLHLVDKDGKRIGDNQDSEKIAQYSYGLSLEELKVLASTPENTMWSLLDSRQLLKVNIAAIRGGYINAIAADESTVKPIFEDAGISPPKKL